MILPESTNNKLAGFIASNWDSYAWSHFRLDDPTPDIRAEAEIFGDNKSVVVSLTSKSGIRDTLQFRRDGSLESFATTIVHRLYERVQEISQVPTLAQNSLANPTRFRDLDADTVLNWARAALCLPNLPNCRPDGARALLFLDRLKNATDATSLALRGAAEAERGNLGDALDALMRARTAPRPGRQGPEAGNRFIGMKLAEVYRKANNYDAAAQEYRGLLRSSPGDGDVRALLIETLRFSGDFAAALAEVDSAAKRGVLGQGARAVVVDMLRDMTVEQLDTHGEAVARACGADRDLAPVCSRTLATRAIATFGAANTTSIRQVLEKLVLRAEGADLRARIAVAAAASYVGSIDFVAEPSGRRVARGASYDPFQFGRFMAIADSGVNLDATSAEWVIRLRSYQRALEQRFDIALVIAQNAFRVLPTFEAPTLAAHVAMAHAANLRMAGPQFADSATRVLNTARSLLEMGEKVLGTNQGLLAAKAALCIDYQADYRCGLETHVHQLNAIQSPTPEQLLNGVEAAALADQYVLAREWYDRIRGFELQGCYLAVYGLFGYWLETERDNRGSAEAALGRFNRGVQALSTDVPSCWGFDGARAKLARSPVPNARELLDMMSRIEGRVVR